jgi:hypothetical protein
LFLGGRLNVPEGSGSNTDLLAESLNWHISWCFSVFQKKKYCDVAVNRSRHFLWVIMRFDIVERLQLRARCKSKKLRHPVLHNLRSGYSVISLNLRYSSNLQFRIA